MISILKIYNLSIGAFTRGGDRASPRNVILPFEDPPLRLKPIYAPV